MAYPRPDLRVFLLQFLAGPAGIEIGSLTRHLDQQQTVLNYLILSPQTLAIVSRANASALTRMIQSAYPSTVFFVAQVEMTKVDGYMPKAFWNFVNRPQSSGLWEPVEPGQ